MENLDLLSQPVAPQAADAMAAMHLLELFRDPDRDIDLIVEFISQDPSLTAETLKRSNNASFRGAERTTDIFEAVNRLGFYELYGIIAASIGSRPLVPSASEPEAYANGGDYFN